MLLLKIKILIKDWYSKKYEEISMNELINQSMIKLHKQLFTIFKLRNYWQYRDFVLRLRVRIMRILSRWHKKIIK